jgi:hypothetical protein
MSGKLDMARWLPHLEAARRSGKSLTRYAAEHGLSRSTLYTARHQAQSPSGRGRSQALAVAQRARGAFAEVRLRSAKGEGRCAAEGLSARATLRARLPNGVLVELDCGDGDPASVSRTSDCCYLSDERRTKWGRRKRYRTGSTPLSSSRR